MFVNEPNVYVNHNKKGAHTMDIKHHYIESGSGKPLILLHGNSENGTYFKHQIEYFSKMYRVIAIDTRGHGQTPRGSAPFTIRQFAEDLHEFFNEQKIDKADVLGFSDGGNIAMIFAMKYPEKINHLILNGANLDTSGIKRGYQIPIEFLYNVAKFRSKVTKKPNKYVEMMGLMVNDPNIRTEELKNISVKTLVIAGTKDMVTKEHTERIYHALPSAQLEFIEGTHFIASKKPAEFNQVVEQFLQS